MSSSTTTTSSSSGEGGAGAEGKSTIRSHQDPKGGEQGNLRTPQDVLDLPTLTAGLIEPLQAPDVSGRTSADTCEPERAQGNAAPNTIPKTHKRKRRRAPRQAVDEEAEQLVDRSAKDAEDTLDPEDLLGAEDLLNAVDAAGEGTADTDGTDESEGTADAEVEHQEEVARQRRADAAWLAAAKSAGFQGPVYDEGADRLWATAYQITKARILNRRMFDDSAAIGRPVAEAAYGHAQLAANHDDLDGLVKDIIGRTWKRFYRDAIVGEGWNEEGGATLAGYLQRACTQEFANTYRQWLRSYLRRSDIATDPMTVSELLTHGRSPTLGRGPVPFRIDDDAQAALDLLTKDQQEVVLLAMERYTRKEIALIVGCSENSVKARISRARTTLKPHYPDWSSK